MKILNSWYSFRISPSDPALILALKGDVDQAISFLLKTLTSLRLLMLGFMQQ